MTKPSSASGVTFRPLDDLFEPTDGSSDKPQLAELDVDSLVPFSNHPFREYPEEKMREMVESVTEHGILMPILVRPIDSGEGYEIISGHNRVEACRRAGIKTIPATIREMDDDTATILMVDSNLRQRDKLLPSEKAKAYQMKMEALQRRAGRPSKNGGQVGHNFSGQKTRDLVAENTDDRNQNQCADHDHLCHRQDTFCDKVRHDADKSVQLGFRCDRMPDQRGNGEAGQAYKKEDQCNLRISL